MISIAIIVKNEEKCLRKCLESVRDADEIVIVDTGSNDKTIEIAREYTDKLFHFKWCDNFAKARNYAKSKCSERWILSVDADHIIKTDFKTIRDECERLDNLGEKVGLVKGQSHWREVLFRNDKGIEWLGAVHEVLNIAAKVKTKIERHCYYSENHYKDPDRNLRILLNNKKTLRSKFYLGREFFEKGKYNEAIKWMLDYLEKGNWLPERAEAQITIAKSYWFTNKGSLARKHCLKAISENPDFGEALTLMSEMTYEPWKSKWNKIAKNATNEDVLFLR